MAMPELRELRRTLSYGDRLACCHGLPCERSRKEDMVNDKARNILAFHKSFLDCVKRTGRLYEIGLVAEYKMRTMNLMQDVDIAPTMMAKGKLGLKPECLKDNAKKVGRIFANTIDKK